MPRAESASGACRKELTAFLFLVAVLIPLLSVAAVAGYGFTVWTSQMLVGPPGPTGKKG